MGGPFHQYQTDEADAIQAALHAAGFQHKKQWEKVYLPAMEHDMRIAVAMASSRPQPYASKAAKQLAALAKALSESVGKYETLQPELQFTIDTELETVLLESPMLTDSISSAEQSVVTSLLSSGRFPLVLGAVRAATESAATKLAHVGKPSVPSEASLRGVPRRVVRTVQEASRARHPNGMFPHTGTPKNHAMRWAVRSLYFIYTKATGSPPKSFSSAHRKGGDRKTAIAEELGGKDTVFRGAFHAFAKAALMPVRLVSARVLDSNITAMTREFRLWLGEDDLEDRPMKK